MRGYLAKKLRQLRPGGRLIIRDVVGPEDGDTEILLWCAESDGLNPPAEELSVDARRDAGWLQRLSTRTRFALFARDFRGPVRPLPYVELEHGSRKMFRLTLRNAAEFLSKKDYTDNWQSEMNEEFCFWSFSRWKSVLAETGFRIRENPNRPESGSRVYTNAWIVEHRYSGSVQLVSENDEALPWPPSNMVLVAEAPWDS